MSNPFARRRRQRAFTAILVGFVAVLLVEAWAVMLSFSVLARNGYGTSLGYGDALTISFWFLIATVLLRSFGQALTSTFRQ